MCECYEQAPTRLVFIVIGVSLIPGVVIDTRINCLAEGPADAGFGNRFENKTP